MIPGSSENENRPQSIAPSVADFLNQGPAKLKEVVSAFPKDALIMPLDERFALQLIEVGQKHLRSLRNVYGSIYGAHTDVPDPQATKESLAAVAFGTGYLAIKEFINNARLDTLEYRTFDARKFLSRFDNTLEDLYKHTPTSSDEYAPEPFDLKKFNTLLRTTEFFGTRIFEEWLWDSLPNSIQGLVKGLDGGKDVSKLAERVAIIVRLWDPKAHTVVQPHDFSKSFTRLGSKGPRQTPEQIERDERLRDLLSGIPGFPTVLRRYSTNGQHSEDLPNPNDPKAPWNNREWLEKLLEDVEM